MALLSCSRCKHDNDNIPDNMPTLTFSWEIDDDGNWELVCNLCNGNGGDLLEIINCAADDITSDLTAENKKQAEEITTLRKRVTDLTKEVEGLRNDGVVPVSAVRYAFDSIMERKQVAGGSVSLGS